LRYEVRQLKPQPKKYSRRYEEEQNIAKRTKAGMWSGEFLEPEVWRKENRD